MYPGTRITPQSGLLWSNESSLSGPFSRNVTISVLRSASVDERVMLMSTVASAPVATLLMLTAKAVIRKGSPLVCASITRVDASASRPIPVSPIRIRPEVFKVPPLRNGSRKRGEPTTNNSRKPPEAVATCGTEYGRPRVV